jgi:hypothetical protein
MASPSWIWNVSYMAVQDLDNGVRNLKDGEIHIWPASKWITLFDDQGIPIIGKFMQPDIDEFKVRSVIEFSAFHAFIDHCIYPTPDVIDATEQDTPIDSSALDLKGKSKASDPISAEVNPKVSFSTADQNHLSKMWKITYSTHKDLDRGRMKAYDGSLSRSVKDDWITLLDAKGKIIGCRYKEPQDNFSVGAKLSFPMHVVRMGQSLNKTTNGMHECMAHASSSGSVPKASVDSKDYQESPQMSHYSLSKILDYSPGIKVAKFCYSQFGRTVHPSASSGHFTMVVSFGRASFRLDESVVGIALEAATGGFSGDLKVSLLRDKVFSFSVSCKSIGFHLFNLRSFACTQFKSFFHLWSWGGPNWQREFQNWQRECEQSWTLVSPTKKRVHLGMSAIQQGQPKPILRKDKAT